MDRRTFNILVACAWVALFIAGNIFWSDLFSLSERLLPELGTKAFPVMLVSFVILALFVQTIIADQIAPKVHVGKDLTLSEKRERAMRDAALAIKQGRKGAAMLIYEEAGLYSQALELAQELSDKPGLARLSCRLGHYSRARRVYLELRDYEAAAQNSALMGEIDTAREYYRQAAEAFKGKATEVQEAALWERGGDFVTAATLYERGADFERAAECYHLLGDERNSIRCFEQAKVMHALEEKQRAENRRWRESRAEQRKQQAAKQAKELETQGDLLGAGILYREAEMPMEAAMAFERFEEWERAAEAYEKAGLKNRADLARMHIQERDKILGKDVEALHTAPSPAAAQSVVFVPISRAQAVPVYMAVMGEPPASPMARLEVCRRVRRGNFLEAAEFAKSAGDWVMAAAYYEHAGSHLAAADIYRQIGDINAATWCLEKAGRLREAAFMALGIGQNARAVEILLRAVEEGKEQQEYALALAEILIQLGKHPLALDVLRKIIAPAGVDPGNADTHYQFARRFEDHKAWEQAHALYADLIAAGAQSDDITQRQAQLAELLAKSRKPEREAAAPPVEKEPDEIEAMLNAVLPEIAKELQAVAKPRAEEPGRTKVFQFTPAAAPAFGLGEAPATGTGGTILLPRAAMSLFGHAVGDAKPAEVFDSKGRLMVDEPELRRREGDLFAPSQRYQVKSELGRGGMGVVYETLDNVLGRRVALKVLLEDSANPEGYQQFLVEARAIALLSHPNVVMIYDIGLINLRHYIAMEFVDGGTLGGLVRKQGALPLKEALRLFLEMCHGLQAAHAAGVVHRDIKPENVLLTQNRQVKISDFGLAKVRKKAEEMGEKADFTVSGTPGFMAPEQLRGDELHPRFDIYSLGVTLFTILVGKAPFQIASKTTLFDIIEFQKSGEQIPLRRFRPNAPESIEQIYFYCTSANPEGRYQAIDAFLPTVEEIHKAL